MDNRLTKPLTNYETTDAILSMKKKKAPDNKGIVAESLQQGPVLIAEFLTPVFSEIINSGTQPAALKEGIIHPILKKGKPKNQPGNYRGITVSPLIGKVLDRIHLAHQKEATPSRNHDLQFGFTEGRSGSHAAFILSESIAESKDIGEPLFAVSLDVQKAFDVVRHESLLVKLHQQGLAGVWWRLKDSAYKDLKGIVQWKGENSESFNISQGNRQGGLPSPDDYKSYILSVLDNIHRSKCGLHIGAINVASPTCADDMLLLARSISELQLLLLLVTTYANQEHYVLHPTKSQVNIFQQVNTPWTEALEASKPWAINGTILPIETKLTHLGVTRDNTSAHLTVEDRISTARRAMYALMGAGLHGVNGLPVSTCLHLFNTYILPRSTYGLKFDHS